MAASRKARAAHNPDARTHARAPMNEQGYLLTCLSEEGVEVAEELLAIVLSIAKVASKAQRFGHNNRRPSDPQGPTNSERLADELNDMIVVAGMLAELGVLPADWNSQEKQDAKRAKIAALRAERERAEPIS